MHCSVHEAVAFPHRRLFVHVFFTFCEFPFSTSLFFNLRKTMKETSFKTNTFHLEAEKNHLLLFVITEYMSSCFGIDLLHEGLTFPRSQTFNPSCPHSAHSIVNEIKGKTFACTHKGNVLKLLSWVFFLDAQFSLSAGLTLNLQHIGFLLSIPQPDYYMWVTAVMTSFRSIRPHTSSHTPTRLSSPLFTADLGPACMSAATAAVWSWDDWSDSDLSSEVKKSCYTV